MALKTDQCLPLEYIQADANFHRSCWHVKVPRKFTFEQTQNPEWWRYNTLIKENDLVDLVGEAGDYDVSCRAVSVVKGAVVLRVLREWHAEKAAQSDASGEAHVALVPGAGWTVFNVAGDPVARFGDEDSARKALAELAPAAPTVPATEVAPEVAA